MKTNKATSRRTFIKQSAIAFAGISIVPRHVLGQGYTAPSDQLNIAAIGGGGKGYTDILHAWNEGTSNVAAICDVDWNMAANAFKKFKKAKRFKDYRKLLDQVKDLDAITISTPDHTHAVIAMDAMKRGIHVYVEKPIANTIEEDFELLTKAEAMDNGKPLALAKAVDIPRDLIVFHVAVLVLLFHPARCLNTL